MFGWTFRSGLVVPFAFPEVKWRLKEQNLGQAANGVVIGLEL